MEGEETLGLTICGGEGLVDWLISPQKSLAWRKPLGARAMGM